MLILKDQGYIQSINQDLKKALNFKDTLLQSLINKNFLKEHQAHEYKFLFGYLLTTPKSTPPPLTSPPLAPTQPSKQSSPLSIKIEHVELIFSTPTTSLHLFFNSLDDLPPRTTNPPPPQSSFDFIEHLANQQPLVLDVVEPTLPPFLP
ncbi:hypothetical protein Tco_1409481 [Tanacetum coccineum]